MHLVLSYGAGVGVDSSFVVMVCGTVVGLIAAVLGISASGFIRAGPTRHIRVLTGSHAFSIVLAGAVALWAFGFPRTGWELLALPGSIMIGQLPAIGVLAAELLQRRSA